MKNLLTKLTPFRGVLGAFALVGLVPNVTDISRYEFLRFIHFFIINWNSTMEAIATALSKIIYIDIQVTVLNFLTVIFTIVTPLRLTVPFHPFSQRARKWLDIFYISAKTTVFITAIIFLIGVLTNKHLFEFDVPEYFIAVILAPTVFLMAITFLSMPIFMYIVLPRYFWGLISGLSFLITLEILYQANTPFFTDFMKSFPDEGFDVPSASETKAP